MRQGRSGLSMKIAFHTLGCKVNQYESQALMQQFAQAGYELVDFRQRADVYVVNTCTVTDTGDKKSRQMISRAHRQNPAAVIAVVGCYAQREAQTLRALPGVRVVLGSYGKGRLVQAVELALAGEAICWIEEGEQGYEELSLDAPVLRTRAYVKIQDGCDMFCSYCAIPYARGRVRSRPLADIAAEAVRLGGQGCLELVVTGIHLSSYGKDFIGGSGLVDALRAICAAPGIHRVRLGSLEPRVVTQEFVQAVAKLPSVCRQFHLALQSGSDAVLAGMRRRYTAAEYLRAAAMLKAAFPGCALTTDVLCGFPGETEANFADTLSVIRAVGFSHIHAFPYSAREGTPAATMQGQLPKAVREARCKEVIRIGEALEASYARGFVGKRVAVLFEEWVDGAWEGFTDEYLRARVCGGGEKLAGKLLEVAVSEVALGKLLCEV